MLSAPMKIILTQNFKMSQKALYTLREKRNFPPENSKSIKYVTYTKFFITVVSIRENANKLMFPKREIIK